MEALTSPPYPNRPATPHQLSTELYVPTPAKASLCVRADAKPPKGSPIISPPPGDLVHGQMDDITHPARPARPILVHRRVRNDYPERILPAPGQLFIRFTSVNQAGMTHRRHEVDMVETSGGTRPWCRCDVRCSPVAASPVARAAITLVRWSPDHLRQQRRGCPWTPSPSAHSDPSRRGAGTTQCHRPNTEPSPT